MNVDIEKIVNEYCKEFCGRETCCLKCPMKEIIRDVLEKELKNND